MSSGWTPSLDTRLKELVNEGKTQNQLADLMGMSLTRVKSRLRRLNLHTGGNAKRHDWTKAEEKHLRKSWGNKHTQTQIAAELGLSRGAIASKIKQLGLYQPEYSHSQPNLWTPEEDTLLLKLIDQKASVPLCVSTLKKRSESAIRKRLQRLRPTQRLTHHSVIPVPRTRTVRYALEAPPETTEGIAFLECRIDQCHWIIGRQRCCGKPISNRTTPLRQPYCDEHYNLSLGKRNEPV